MDWDWMALSALRTRFWLTNHADVAAAAWTIEQSFKGGQVVSQAPPGDQSRRRDFSY